MAPPLRFALLSQDSEVDLLILQTLRLDLLEVNDLFLGTLLGFPEPLLGSRQLSLVGGHFLLRRGELSACLVVDVHRIRRRLGDDADERFGLHLLAGSAVARQDRDAATPARHEPVHGDLGDLRPQCVDLVLEGGLLCGELCGPVREDVEVGLRVGELGGRLVRSVTRRADLASSFFSSVLVGTWERCGRPGRTGCDDDGNGGGADSSTNCRRAAMHGGAP